jgi:hypothetical protein
MYKQKQRKKLNRLKGKDTQGALTSRAEHLIITSIHISARFQEVGPSSEKCGVLLCLSLIEIHYSDEDTTKKVVEVAKYTPVIFKIRQINFFAHRLDPFCNDAALIAHQNENIAI